MRSIVGVFLFVTSFLIGGCGPAASPGDRTLIDQSASLQRAVSPVLLDSEAGLSRYFQQIGDRIVSAAHDLHNEHFGPSSHFAEPSDWMFTKNIQFHLASLKTINVFTAGGEHIYVFNGLFQKCNNEDELAAVLAHQYAHVYCRHIQRAAAGESGDAQPALVVRRLIENPFTAREEQEADQIGFMIYARAGWDPARYADIFQRLGNSEARVASFRGFSDTLPPASRDWGQAPIADDRRFIDHRDATAKKKPTNSDANMLLIAAPVCVTPMDQPEQKAAQLELLRPVIQSPGAFEKGGHAPR